MKHESPRMLFAGQVPDNQVVSTLSVAVADANPDRCYLRAYNAGPDAAYGAFGQTALDAKGVVLLMGEWAEWGADGVSQEALNFICGAGDSCTIMIHEGNEV